MGAGRTRLGNRKEARVLSQSWPKVASFIALALATVALSGCSKVEVVDRAPPVLDAVPSGHARVADHDLAVLAVDFDPPLEYDEIMARRNRGEGITLLVAVENTGASTEREIVVQVELAQDGGETVFLRKEGHVDVIAPGEVKIVQFKDTDIPFSYTYLLKVAVSPVPGETLLGDNHRNYDLLITRP